VHGAVELAIVGDPASGDFKALAQAASRHFVPSLVLAGGLPGQTDVALLRDRVARDGRSTAYLCRGYVCEEPVSDPARLAEQLEGAVRARAT